ncbi:thioredoxin-dependent thiol peroxidase [Jiulongibacter sediminis]|uniref:thioredoxin-dependent peroxiredoxin n=1 Tax=Jiulongibacter sediminis TaxID=1605367 RepID=A0A0N8HA93_9BACT|nr:thioredoxin-dependent thiol peroxidase [Jiulongibacter sediminis]KPM49532.1 thiol peroxidase [Jiulongibacter sediminis]TBX26574.1 thiol peroxidase [Jiulongibacter sediminis]
MALKIGDKAPDFEVKNQNNETVKLSDFKGQKVVLYFYPKDNTPTCTTQACNIRDNYQQYTSKGIKVLGVSPDSAKKHQNFIKKFDLPFDLLVDDEKALNEAYGVWQEKQMYGKKYMGTVRTTFVIDENGVIENIIDNVKAKEHTDQILA